MHLKPFSVINALWPWPPPQSRTLPCVSSPTGLHPVRGDYEWCKHVISCLPSVVPIFNGLYMYSATSFVSVSTVTHYQSSPLYSIWTWNGKIIKLMQLRFSMWDWSHDLKHHGHKSMDISSFPMRNPIFQQSIVNISGFLKFKIIKFCNVHIPLHLFPVIILIIPVCCEICKSSCYI